jgi:NAD(P)H-dependent FMN reductase
MMHANDQKTIPPTVLVIMGSVRAGRISPTVADWLLSLAGNNSTARYELVDLADWHLPMNDEPGIPAMGNYAQTHTRAWGAKVASGAAFVFLTPQYNWGYPAALKNAIDHVYQEWRGKPLMIVTYGGHGGTKCAAQLWQVAEGLKMDVLPTMPALTLPEEVIRGAALDPAQHLAPYAGDVERALVELEARL